MSELERIVTPIPGPRSVALAKALRAVEARGVTYVGADAPIFWERASGATVTDVDGNRYIDATSAFGVALTGHANPQVAGAIADQAARLPHGMGDVHPTEAKLRLLERLVALAPVPDARGFLCSGGAESVEFALKTALLATGRPNALAFAGSYHGLAHGALEITGAPRFRDPFRAQLRDATAFVPYPDRRAPDTAGASLTAVDAALRADPSIGAVVVEPIQGRGGVIVPPDGFLPDLRALCTAHAVLLIVDEIYTGFGRTGTMFACQREGVVPDIVCVGKALAGGFPLSAALGARAVMDAWPPSTGEALHTSTYLGNPMGCAAALANLDQIERIDAPTRAVLIGDAVAARAGELATRSGVRDVRGRGAFWGIELADGESARAATARALRSGLIALQAGARGEVFTFTPPVTIEPAQLERALELVAAALPA